MNLKALLLYLFISFGRSSTGDSQGKPNLSFPVSARGNLDFEEGDVVELWKDQRISIFDGLLHIEPQYMHTFQFHPENRSYLLTCARVEDSGLYTYHVISKTNETEKFKENIYVHVNGPEMNPQPVPIGGFPNFDEKNMVANLCRMNGSDCPQISSYQYQTLNDHKYEDRIDFNNVTGFFILRNVTKSDIGMYIYTMTVTQNGKTDKKESIVYLRIIKTGVCAKDNTRLTVQYRFAGALIALGLSFILVAYICKRMKNRVSSGVTREEKQNEENVRLMNIGENPKPAPEDALFLDDAVNSCSSSDSAPDSEEIHPREDETEENNEESPETRQWEPYEENLDMKPGVMGNNMSNTIYKVDNGVVINCFNYNEEYIEDTLIHEGGKADIKISTF